MQFGQGSVVLVGKSENLRQGKEINSLEGEKMNLLLGKEMNLLLGKEMNMLLGQKMNLLLGQKMNLQLGQKMNLLLGQKMDLLLELEIHTLLGQGRKLLLKEHWVERLIELKVGLTDHIEDLSPLLCIIFCCGFSLQYGQGCPLIGELVAKLVLSVWNLQLLY